MRKSTLFFISTFILSNLILASELDQKIILKLFRSVEAQKQILLNEKNDYDRDFEFEKLNILNQKFTEALYHTPKDQFPEIYKLNGLIHQKEKKPSQPLSSKKHDDEISSQVKDLFTPLLSYLKRITERPRKVEALQNQIDKTDEHIKILQAGLERISLLKKNMTKPAEKKSLSQLESSTNQLLERLMDNSKMSQIRLDKWQGKTSNLIERVEKSFYTFFQRRGKNLFFLILFLSSVFIILNILRNPFIKLTNEYLPPTLGKFISVSYHLISFLILNLGALFLLYILNDWILLTFFFFILVGLFYSFKNFGPLFYFELKMALNLGPIREGERIIFEGVPWKVHRISWHVQLENPNFGTLIIKVPLKMLIDHYSRPLKNDEQWFPIVKNDIIQIEENEIAQVEYLTPDFITIQLSGNEKKYIPTKDFLSLNYINLSHGFSIRSLLGIDYKHLNQINEKTCSEINNQLNQYFQSHLGKDTEKIKFIVYFKEMAESSLNFSIILKIDGKLADKKFKIDHLLQMALLKIVKTFNWEVPFNQMTIHLDRNSFSMDQSFVKNES